MLLQFSVGNFLSFKDEVALNMMPASLKTKKEHLIVDERNKKTSALPLALFYGANAAGKSNLIKAMSIAQEFVIDGVDSYEALPMKPFRLDSEAEKLPTRFEFIFKHDGIVYTYGFVATRTEVKEEWLFAHFTAQESKIFERITDSEGNAEVDPGPRLIRDTKKGKSAIDVISSLTGKHQLFLAKANENNIDLVKPVLHWFRDHLTIVAPDSRYIPLELRSYQDQGFFDYLSSFLNKADTGIDSLQYKTEEFDPDKHLAEVPQELRSEIEKELFSASDSLKPQAKAVFKLPFSSYVIFVEKKDSDSSPEVTAFKLQTKHRRTDGSYALFDLEDESDGTRRMMHLAPMFHEISSLDRVIVIDEIDRSLHTELTKAMLKLCLSGAKSEDARGQFIVTTHDTNLIDLELFRRDEIRFIEKDDSGASHITNLVEYKVSDGLNCENGYLDGRFGAVPYLRELEGILQ